jgi:hypothetical protein
MSTLERWVRSRLSHAYQPNSKHFQIDCLEGDGHGHRMYASQSRRLNPRGVTSRSFAGHLVTGCIQNLLSAEWNTIPSCMRSLGGETMGQPEVTTGPGARGSWWDVPWQYFAPFCVVVCLQSSNIFRTAITGFRSVRLWYPLAATSGTDTLIDDRSTPVNQRKTLRLRLLLNKRSPKDDRLLALFRPQRGSQQV